MRPGLHVKPIPRALWRPHLVAGAEREPFLASALVLGGLALTSMNLVTIASCTVLWLCFSTTLRWMAKSDPQMFAIYRRSLIYRRHYPPLSRPYRRR